LGSNSTQWSGGNETPVSPLSANELDLGVLTVCQVRSAVVLGGVGIFKKIYIIIKCAHSCYFFSSLCLALGLIQLFSPKKKRCVR